MGGTSNHKPRPSNDTDQRQQATGHQTANMCGGGETHILGLRRGEVHALNVNLTKSQENRYSRSEFNVFTHNTTYVIV